MSVQRIHQLLHIRQKSNLKVWRNIERLHDIANQDFNHSDLLEQLHPWREPPSLKFNNGLSVILGIAAVFSLLSLLLFPVLHVPTLLGVAITLTIAFLAYALYESKTAITDVVARLEQDAIRSLYQLQYGQLPAQQLLPMRASTLMSQMQMLFPVFQQGNLSNAIHAYAATIWQGRSGKDYSVLVFQYHYIDKVETRDKQGQRIKVSEKHADRWGVLLFDSPLHGLAISNLGRLQNVDFGRAYPERWQTSDIDTNQKLSIYCNDALQAAKSLRPATVLAVNQLFEQQRGVLMCHPHQAILCFLGEQNLLEYSTERPKIEDISQLRGHLRTFRLYPYETLQKAITALLT